MIIFDALKDGKKHAVTLSYDDGSVHDERLIGILDKYGIKSTFHLCSDLIGCKNHIKADRIKELYKNHEIACHGSIHAPLNMVSDAGIVREVYEDRIFFEELCGYPLRGMSYAYGLCNNHIADVIASCGMEYCRTVGKSKGFAFPDNFLLWNPTCHHSECLEHGKQFLETIGKWYVGSRLLYVWGHSHEFNADNNWEIIEEFCKMISGYDDIWYATNIEICQYVKAQRSLIISADQSIVYNPNAIEVWFTKKTNIDETVYSVKPGETIKI